jgi:hypothetical protein
MIPVPMRTRPMRKSRIAMMGFMAGACWRVDYLTKNMDRDRESSERTLGAPATARTPEGG